MKKRILIIVDPQNDFISGSLAVPEAIEAMDNLTEHVRKHGTEYDEIIVSLDTHNPTNLGFKENWEGPGIDNITECQPFPKGLEGIQPKFKYTRVQDIRNVQSQPGFMCWPAHCIKGTPGHDIYGPLYEALKETCPDKVRYLTKGEDDARDNYSIYHYGDGGLTEHGIRLHEEDLPEPVFYVTGLALDYCVLETIRSLQSIFGIRGTYYLGTTMGAAIQPDRIEDLYSELVWEVEVF